MHRFPTHHPTFRDLLRFKTAKSTVIRLGYSSIYIPAVAPLVLLALRWSLSLPRSKSSHALDTRFLGVDFDIGIGLYIFGEDLALVWIDLEPNSPISKNSSSPPIAPAVTWGASTD